MEKNRNGFLFNETHRECTRCREIYEISNKMTICKRCNTERVKSNSLEYKMMARAKSRSVKSGQPFNIDATDVDIPTHCPVLGIELKATVGKSGAFAESPSLDRTIPHLGYTKGNVQVMSQLANQMKGSATPEQLLLFAAWVNKTYSKVADAD